MKKTIATIAIGTATLVGGATAAGALTSYEGKLPATDEATHDTTGGITFTVEIEGVSHTSGGTVEILGADPRDRNSMMSIQTNVNA